MPEIQQTPQQLREIAATYENMARHTHRAEIIEWLIANARSAHANAERAERAQLAQRQEVAN